MAICPATITERDLNDSVLATLGSPLRTREPVLKLVPSSLSQ
ncbi:hypothetical protein NJ7G_1523 [Natrinema sp. J7-2]|nr:hypothetical protein NJ7G_1523 [Natrinema sp. J7-2]